MKVLIVGGTGMIGVQAARELQRRGAAVTVGARKAPAADAPAAAFPLLIGDYTSGGFSRSELSQFDAVVFAAGNDIRHIPAGADAAEFWRRTQSEGVPAFAARVRDAGVARLIQIGSYYHQLRPELAQTLPYVAARRDADDRTRALAAPGFCVATLNPPSIVGALPGASALRYRGLTAWARGQSPQIGHWAPPGGTNYMSLHALGQAIAAAVERAHSGQAYLIGDENLSYRAFFQMFFDAVGSGVTLDTRDAEHPLLPDRFIVQGRGHSLRYEPDAAQTALLGYDRKDIARAVAEVVAMVGSTP